LFILGTGLALTLFVDVYAVGGDRMNTIFKLYIQSWLLLSVAAGAALAWVWAELAGWTPSWRGLWMGALAVLVGLAAFYTVTAANTKIRDRFPAYSAQPSGTPGASCQEIAGMPNPYPNGQSLPVSEQPHSLNGSDYMQWSAYCDNTYFLPMAYDHDAIRWLQDNVDGSPVIVEAHATEYKYGTRYTINTGLPGVMGWNYHQRQERGAVSTDFIWSRVKSIAAFYCSGAGADEMQLGLYPLCLEAMSVIGSDLSDEWLLGYQTALVNSDRAVDWALDFLRAYEVEYIVVGPLERAYYPPGGLAKFEAMAAQGRLSVAYQNPGVTIYKVQTLAAQ
jgi:uncharacterized membrane protein